jgi:DNA-binding NarL/FixJ family response regulator
MMISGILSRREVEILELVSSGLSNQDIAMRLGITNSTVKTHLRNIYLKTDQHTRANLAISFLTSKT